MIAQETLLSTSTEVIGFLKSGERAFLAAFERYGDSLQKGRQFFDLPSARRGDKGVFTGQFMCDEAAYALYQNLERVIDHGRLSAKIVGAKVYTPRMLPGPVRYFDPQDRSWDISHVWVHLLSEGVATHFMDASFLQVDPTHTGIKFGSIDQEREAYLYERPPIDLTTLTLYEENFYTSDLKRKATRVDFPVRVEEHRAWQAVLSSYSIREDT